MTDEALKRAYRILEEVCEQLREAEEEAVDEVDALSMELEETVRERDAARREVCSLEADTTEDQREYAVQRGWTDLFPKEQNDHTCAQVPAVRSDHGHA